MSNLEEAEQDVRIKTKRIISVAVLIMIFMLIFILLSSYLIYAFTTNMGIAAWKSTAILGLYLSSLLIVQYAISPRIFASSLGLRYIADDEFMWLRQAVDNALFQKRGPRLRLAISPDRNPSVMIFGNIFNMTLAISEGLIINPDSAKSAVIREIKAINPSMVGLVTLFSSIPLMASSLASTILGEKTIISPYFKTPDTVARRMLTLAELKPNEIVYDLGSGYGHILLLAAESFNAKGIGIEIDKAMVNRSKSLIKERGLEAQIKVIHGNIFQSDLRNADVVTLFLGVTVNMMLRPKLERELKKGARIVSHDFEIPGWNPIKTEKMNESHEVSDQHSHVLYLYEKQ